MTRQHSPKICTLDAAVLFLAVLTALIAFAAPAQQAGKGQSSAKSSAPSVPADQARVLDSYGKLPLSFEANQGQTDARVKFLSRTDGYSLFLTDDEAVLTLRGRKAKKSSPQGLKPAALAGSSGKAEAMPFTTSRDDVVAEDMANSVLRMKLRNANLAAKVTGVDELAGTSNYFIGNHPAKWRTNVPTYAKVKYEGIYSGIDLVYYGNQRQLEYDFIVTPGADPHHIAFDVRGAKRVRRDEHGDLALKVGERVIRLRKPVAYQEKEGARQEIAARYTLTDTNRVGFDVAEYDATRPLYIDPLIYSTYLGGSGADECYGIALDRSGNAYVACWTQSTDFPTMNPLQSAYGGGSGDAIVAKLDPSGSALVYSTYLGGGGNDGGYGIGVDSAGNAYVTGFTSSTDFPTVNPWQSTYAGGDYDSFVAKLNSSGTALVYSTYLGGSGDDYSNAIAVDSAGNAYVTGYTGSTNFPTANPLQPTNGGGLSDAFVAKLNPSGSALVYSTYLGGSQLDTGYGIAVDGTGNAYIMGYTQSTDLPVTPGAFRTVCNSGCGDIFVAKINSAGSALAFSTYLGGGLIPNAPDETGGGIAVDGAGNTYVTGGTGSTAFPVTPGAFQATCNGGSNCAADGDAFVSKLNPGGSALVYSTYLGGTESDFGTAIAVDSAGNAYVTGYTGSTDFPTANPLQPTNGGGLSDAFVAKLNPSGSALVYSTYLGGSDFDGGNGIAVDGSGNAYLAGITSSTDFPTVNPLQSAYSGGGYDAFVAKLSFCTTPPVITLSTTPTSLWPPNGKMVQVTVSGTITDTGCTVTSAAYAVTDEYGQVQPSGAVTLGAGGAYSFTVLLQASRLGTDLDGRLYTITVSASNNAGKTGSEAGTVIVPHDQGH